MCRVTWAGQWPVRVGEKVRLAVDFADDQALEGGDTLTGTPTFTPTPAITGVTISGSANSGTKATALFDLTAGTAVPATYAVEVSVSTTAGQVLERLAHLLIEA